MQTSGVLSSAEGERAEIATVVEALARSPRLAHLLRYMGEKYFRGESDQLKEVSNGLDSADLPPQRYLQRSL